MHSVMNDCGVEIVTRKMTNSNNKWVVYEDNSKKVKDEFRLSVKPQGVFDAGNKAHFGGVDKLPQYSNVRIFRDGFSPNWEDYKNGGQLSMRFKKDSTLRNWKLLVNAVIEQRAPHMDHILGLVLSIRPGSNAAHLWCADSNMIQKNADIMKFVLSMMNVHVVYVPFQVLKQRNQKNQEKTALKMNANNKKAAEAKRRLSDNSDARSDVWSEASTECIDSRKSSTIEPAPECPPSDGTRTPPAEEVAPAPPAAVPTAVSAKPTIATLEAIKMVNDDGPSLAVAFGVAAIAVMMMALAVATATMF